MTPEFSYDYDNKIACIKIRRTSSVKDVFMKHGVTVRLDDKNRVVSVSISQCCDDESDAEAVFTTAAKRR